MMKSMQVTRLKCYRMVKKGEVLELVSEEEAVVQMGIIKMKLPIEDLEKTKRKRKPSKMVTRQNRQTIKTELDLRGYRWKRAN